MSLNSDRKSTRLNSSHTVISYAVFCLKKKKGFRRARPEINQYTSTRGSTLPGPRGEFERRFLRELGRFLRRGLAVLVFFCNDTATTEIYTLSLHDALPISAFWIICRSASPSAQFSSASSSSSSERSEEHTSELQSHSDLVCRLLLEKK